MDSYLTLAQRVLRKARRPLAAREMLDAAYRMSAVPPDLYGRTQHKTMQARLSEDIKINRDRSLFFRNSPGRFFLREFLADQNIPESFRREYPAPPRADQLMNFRVACLERSLVETYPIGELFEAEAAMNASATSHVLREALEAKSLIVVRSFSVVLRAGKLLMRRPGRGLHGSFGGKVSLGVIGFLKEDDRTMFSDDPFGSTDSTLRTLAETINMHSEEISFLRRRTCVQRFGFLSLTNERSQMAIAAINVSIWPEPFDPVSRLSAESTFSWKVANEIPNDWSVLDPWSRELSKLGFFGEISQA